LYFLVDLFVGEGVGVVFVAFSFECAEDAFGGADVGVVDVAVDDVGAEVVAVDFFTSCVCVSAEGVEWCLCEELEGLFWGDACLALGDGAEEAWVCGVEVWVFWEGLVDGHGGL